MYIKLTKKLVSGISDNC